jgi:hypothetical protein
MLMKEYFPARPFGFYRLFKIPIHLLDNNVIPLEAFLANEPGNSRKGCYRFTGGSRCFLQQAASYRSRLCRAGLEEFEINPWITSP